MNGFIGENDKCYLALFISLMRMRVPVFVKFMTETYSTALHAITRANINTGAISPPPEGITLSDLEFKISNWFLMDKMDRLIFDDIFISLLVKMDMQIFSVPNDCELLTCDNPVAVFDPHCESNACYGGGLVSQDVEISIPLSLRHVLLLNVKSRMASAGKTFTYDYVEELNRRTIIMADDLIFGSSSAHGKYKKLIQDNLMHQAGFRIRSGEVTDGTILNADFVPVLCKNKY